MSESFNSDIKKLVDSTKSGIRASSFKKALSDGNLSSLRANAEPIAKIVSERSGFIVGNRYDRAARKTDLKKLTKNVQISAQAQKDIERVLDALGHRKELLVKKEEPQKPAIQPPKPKAENRRMPSRFDRLDTDSAVNKNAPYHLGGMLGSNSGVNSLSHSSAQSSGRTSLPKLVK